LFSRGKLSSFHDAPSPALSRRSRTPSGVSYSLLRTPPLTPARLAELPGVYTPEGPRAVSRGSTMASRRSTRSKGSKGPLPCLSELYEPAELETWPNTPPVKHTPQRATRLCDLEIPDLSSLGTTQNKPHFLRELEAAAAEQLSALGHDQLYSSCQPDTPHPDRIQIFSAVLLALMEHFPAYAGCFEQIQRVYVEHFEDRIARIEGADAIYRRHTEGIDSIAEGVEQTEQALVGDDSFQKLTEATKEAEQRLALMHDEEVELKTTSLQLQHNIESWGNEVKQLHGQAVEVAKRVKMQQEMLDGITGAGHDYEAERLRLIREFGPMNDANMQMREVSSGMALREDLNITLEEVAQAKCAIATLKSNDAGEQVLQKKIKSNQKLAEEVAQLGRRLGDKTYRPPRELKELEDEERTAEVVPKLAELVRTTFRELQDIQEELPPELLSDSDEEQAEDWIEQKFFTGLGIGEDVPMCFRFEGTIQNRLVNKGDTERLIKDYWKCKKYSDAKEKVETAPVDFLYTWLSKYKKHPTQELVADWAYNLKDAALRCSYDADCELWYKVIEGEYDQALYWDEFDMLEEVSSTFQKEDVKENSKVTGKLMKNKFLAAMRRIFPLKTEVRHNRLKRCLAKEDAAQGSKVGYVAVFSEDKNGDQGPFAEMVRDQYKEERDEYLDDLRDVLEREAPDGKLTAEMLLAAFEEIDPKKPERSREQYVRTGLGDLAPPVDGKKKKQKINDSFLRIEIDYEVFMQNLSRVVVKSSTNRDQRLAEMTI